MKRLRNIEGKNEEQLKAIVDQGRKQLDVIKNIKTDSKSLKTISFYWIKSRGKKKQTKTVRCAKKGKILLILKNVLVQNMAEQVLTSILLKTC